VTVFLDELQHLQSDVLRGKLIGPAMKASAEVLDTVEVRADGCISEVAALQVLKDELA
jgi:hypothetical protein